MKRQEELNEAWCSYRGKCSTEIIQALSFALRWCDEHPHWISVEDELPKCDQPFYDYFGDIDDELVCSEEMLVLIGGKVYIATLNQDMHNGKPRGEPYWIDERADDSSWIGNKPETIVTHWMPTPQPPKKGDEE